MDSKAFSAGAGFDSGTEADQVEAMAEIVLREDGDRRVLSVAGCLTIYDVEEVWSSLSESEARETPVIVDLESVEEIDTAGIQVLIRWIVEKCTGSNGNGVEFRHGSVTKDIFEFLNLESLIYRVRLEGKKSWI